MRMKKLIHHEFYLKLLSKSTILYTSNNIILPKNLHLDQLENRLDKTSNTKKKEFNSMVTFRFLCMGTFENANRYI